ncbi:MAG: gamma-glutamyltransferase family protein [Desulforhopalus sp.]
MYDKSIVASGHQYVSEAAAEVLAAGGNAFDAIVAAGFAAAVVEPALTSLGGGGFMVGHDETTGEDLFFDFFVDSPGRGKNGDLLKTDFFAVTVNFSGSSQEFNVGLGSVAVPGTLKGLLHIHKRLGRMPLREVVHPAQVLARGHLLNDQQGHFLNLLHPIMTLTERSRQIFQPAGKYLEHGATMENLALVQFLEQVIVEGDESFYRGELAGKIHKEMAEGGGLLTVEDLRAYRVKERRPLKIDYRDNVFLTAPEPSMGGTLIGLSLSLLSRQSSRGHEWGSGSQLLATLGLMKEVERLRGKGVTTPAALARFLDNQDQLIDSADNMRLFSRGTTHVSIADAQGNCASMTCSNGEGSGYVAPDSGVMLNNMMGEDDLHPNGFHAAEPGIRVFSMMSPSLLIKDDRVRLVIGSGGSKRIRTAVSQVLSQVVDFDRSLQQAVDSPRMYLDEDCLQLEPGFDEAAVNELRQVVEVNTWPQQDVYFGGVHAVVPGIEGAGDPRRGGAAVTVTHPTENS